MAALAEPEEVRAHLIAAAAAGESITYAGLLELLGFPFSRPRMRQLCALLGEVDAIGAALGEPPLAVLVVRQSDGLPGQGWWIGAAREHDYRGPWEGPEARALVTQLQQQVFQFWSEKGRFGGGTPVNHLSSPIGGSDALSPFRCDIDGTSS